MLHHNVTFQIISLSDDKVSFDFLLMIEYVGNDFCSSLPADVIEMPLESSPIKVLQSVESFASYLRDQFVSSTPAAKVSLWYLYCFAYRCLELKQIVIQSIISEIINV